MRAVFLVVALALFPVMAAVWEHFVSPRVLVLVLIGLLLARAVVTGARGPSGMIAAGALCVAVCEAALGFWSPVRATKFYPAIMNAATFIVFAITLWRPPSMIERFALLVEPTIDSRGVHYTRWATIAWLGFFLMNGLISLWTAVEGTSSEWALYNGVISYVLMGIFVAAEYLIRQRVRFGRRFL